MGASSPSLFSPRCTHLGSLRKGYQLITLCLCLQNVTVVLTGTVSSCSPPLLKELPVLEETAAMPFCGPFEAELDLLTALTGWRGVQQALGAGWGWGVDPRLVARLQQFSMGPSYPCTAGRVLMLG